MDPAWVMTRASTIAQAQSCGDLWLAGRLRHEAVWEDQEGDVAGKSERTRALDRAVSARLRPPRGLPIRRRLAGMFTSLRMLGYIALGPRWHRWLYYRRDRAVAPAPRDGAIEKPASIVMLTFNRLAYVRQTLAALHASLRDESEYELIVVDNGSTDGTAELLRSQAGERLIDKLILRRTNHGTPAGFNCGFAHARRDAEFYVRLDSDVSILTPGWLRAFRSLLQKHPHVGAVALYQPNHPVLRLLPVVDGPDGIPLIDWSNWSVGGGAMTIPRTVFERIGFLREDFGFEYVPDDADYYHRLRMFGYSAYYLRNFEGYHHMEKDLGEYRRYSERKSTLTGANQLSVLSLLAAKFRKRAAPWEEAIARTRTEYHRDPRAAVIHYPHYANLAFPTSTRVLEIA